MGRYTTFSDQDAQGAAVPYSAATTAGNPSAPAVPSTGDANDAKNPVKLNVNRVDNVAGSSAGAGSGEFHTYRASRRREMERVAAMEQRYKENKAQIEFETKRKRNAEEFDAKMQKRAEKRRRRKERAKAKALDAVQEEEEEEEEKKVTEEEEETSAEKKEQVPETPGGVPEIPNDGSFLEKMLALQEERKE